MYVYVYVYLYVCICILTVSLILSNFSIAILGKLWLLYVGLGYVVITTSRLLATILGDDYRTSQSISDMHTCNYIYIKYVYTWKHYLKLAHRPSPTCNTHPFPHDMFVTTTNMLAPRSSSMRATKSKPCCFLFTATLYVYVYVQVFVYVRYMYMYVYA